MELLASPAAGAVLAGAAVVLVVLSAVTARPPADVPDRAGYLRRWQLLHGGYDPAGSIWVRGWLAIAYTAGRPLAAAGVRPDVLTALGVWLSAAAVVPAAAAGRWPLLAALVVVASGLGDTLDGCVAVLTDRTSRWGYVLDSLADRVSDLLGVLALVALAGLAPAAAWGAAAASTGLFLLEYLRARAGNAGAGDIGVVTVGERPNRIIAIAVTLGCAGLFPERAVTFATAGLWILAAMCVVGLVQFGVVAHRTLRA